MGAEWYPILSEYGILCGISQNEKNLEEYGQLTAKIDGKCFTSYVYRAGAGPEQVYPGRGKGVGGERTRGGDYFQGGIGRSMSKLGIDVLSEFKSYRSKDMTNYAVPAEEAQPAETKGPELPPELVQKLLEIEKWVQDSARIGKKNLIELDSMGGKLSQQLSARTVSEQELVLLTRERMEQKQVIKKMAAKFMDHADQIDSLREYAAAAGDARLQERVEAYDAMLRDSLAEVGITEIPAQGLPFNPEHHNRQETIHAPDQPLNYCVQVIRRGYFFEGKVLRIAAVTVNR